MSLSWRKLTHGLYQVANLGNIGKAYLRNGDRELLLEVPNPNSIGINFGFTRVIPADPFVGAPGDAEFLILNETEIAILEV